MLGKTIISFCPHGDSSVSNTINTIKKLQPNTTVNEDGLTIARGDVTDSHETIVEWHHDLGFYKKFSYM